jgi:glycosyltransferase involved in cell wall biosynthesis
VLISPVKDEARFVESTLRSVVSQTALPVLWVIVDDGSSDETCQIVRRYAAAHPFIQLVESSDTGSRQPGARVIQAFNRGCRCLEGVPYEFLVKLDCDLSFEPRYFEALLGRFERDPRLGIASGVYAEKDRTDTWAVVPMPAYHAFGASKMVRRSCFEEIGGFLVAKGWDTVDEIRAWNRGWKTQHYADLVCRHHKREGSGIGQLRTNVMHGHIYYVTGGDPLFLVFKILRRMTSSPVVVGALALWWGYLSALVRRTPRLVTTAEMRAYRRLLRRRLWSSARRSFALRPAVAER